MAVFTAVAAAVSAAVGGGIFGAVAGFAARTLLTVGITKLIGNRAGKTAAGTSDAGSRVQLPPASNNKLPVVYGTAYMAPIITDAKISTDQKTMWYVCALAEVTDTGSYTFGDIYWAGKKVVFDGTDTSKVVQLETNSDPVQIDDKVSGKIHIYKFPNGSASGISTGGSNAITLLSDSAIPSDQRWNGPIYTTGGQSAAMTNTAFIVVKVDYNRDANTTRLEQINVELTNSLTKPGDVLYDYMTNIRYGCAIDTIDVDLASITDLNDYSDELITYIPVGGGTATKVRYRINGPVNTGQNCLNNLQELIDACDSWLQYSELSGQWTIVVNKPYNWDGTTLADLYQVNDDVLISGINVNPIDLNSAYNVLEVQFPDNKVNDQTNYKVINLIDFAPEVMSYNEPQNILTVQFPQVNDYLQSTYLGVRRLLQSREDLTIDFLLDYSGIQVVAGDVICVPFKKYGWNTENSGYGKLFRVSQVQEAKLDDGTLGARITAFEYNGDVYADDAIQDYEAAGNTGLSDPNIYDKPGTPTVTTNPLTDGNVKSFKVTSTVPANGSVMYMDYNYGTSNDTTTHRLLRTIQTADGNPFVSSASTSIDVTTLPPNTYYFSTTARTVSAGRTSNSSSSYVWGGPNVTEWDPGTSTGGITNNNIANTTITSSKMTNTGVTAGSYTNTNLTVDSAGRITLAANGSSGGGSVPVGTTNMIVVGPLGSSASTGENSIVNYAHNITYSLKDISIGLGSGAGIGYLDGTTVAADYIMPFATGYSDTANLFGATSTSAFFTNSAGPTGIPGSTPPLAAIQGPLYPNYSGSPPNLGGWSLLKSVTISPYYTSIADDVYVTCHCNFQVISDSDTTMVYGGGYSLDGNNHYITQDKVGTVELKTKMPKQIPFNFSYRGGYPSANAVELMSLWIKNIVSGTRIYFTMTSMVITQVGIDTALNWPQGYPYSPYA